MPLAGQVFNGESLSVANGAYVTIRPATGHEAAIHNLCYTGAIEVYLYTTSNVLFDLDDAAGNWAKQSIPITYASYAKIKNVSGTVINVCWNGRYTWPTTE
jgi:hypothetical protein